ADCCVGVVAPRCGVSDDTPGSSLLPALHSPFFGSLLLTIAFLLASAPSAQAQFSLGNQRAGTSSGSFLKIGVGARATALGEAFVAVAHDAGALYWNPA